MSKKFGIQVTKESMEIEEIILSSGDEEKHFFACAAEGKQLETFNELRRAGIVKEYRGEWLENSNGQKKCSECGYVVDKTDFDLEPRYYCNNCGTRLCNLNRREDDANV